MVESSSRLFSLVCALLATACYGDNVRRGRELSQAYEISSIQNNHPTFQDQANEINSRSKTLTAVVHIGLMKTGSTAIQRMLYPLKGALAQDGYEADQLVVGSDYQTVNFVRCFRKAEFGDKYEDFHQFGGRSNACKDEYVEAVQKIAERGHNVIISAEFLATPERDVEAFKKFLQPWQDVQVIAYYRRYYEWYYSFWNQNEKFKAPTQRNNIANGLTNRAKTEEDFFDEFYVGSIMRWKEHFDTVKVYNLHAMHDKDVRDTFFCNALPHADRTCSKYRYDRANGLHGKQENPTEPIVYRDLAWFAREMGLWKEDEEKGLTLEKVATLVQKRQEDELNMNQLDFEGLHCPDPSVLDWVLEKSLLAEKMLFPEYFEAQGEREIREDFEKIKRKKFCYVDAQFALQGDAAWQAFFKSL